MYIIACDKGLFTVKYHNDNALYHVSTQLKGRCIMSVCYVKDSRVILGMPSKLILFDFKKNKLLATIPNSTDNKYPWRLLLVMTDIFIL